MHKRIDIHDLEIPTDDLECWEWYPKHRWMYDLSRLLDVQSIKWSPFSTTLLKTEMVNMQFETSRPVDYKSATIFVDAPDYNHVISEVFIVKGEIKHIRHFNETMTELAAESTGNIELRISAFVSIHLQKFTGVISVATFNCIIFKIQLKPKSDLSLTTDNDIVKLIKRIYKKSDVIHLIGPVDHVLHESLAS